jgi:Na+/melibiose symporter-like transporter
MEPQPPLHVSKTLISLPAGLQGDFRMIVSALVTFLVVILVLYLINLLPIDGRAKQIARVVVIILGVISLLKYIAVF